jgi:phosphoribosylformylglycinamidine synthase
MTTTAVRSRALASQPETGPRALVMRAPGTNCHRETVLALELAGARPDAVHLEEIMTKRRRLDDFAMIVLPGGFAHGDHLGAGTLWSHLLEAVNEPLQRFVDSGRPVLGICNGFQALVRLGLLEGGSLTRNASGRFECRWVWLQRPSNVQTPLMQGIDRIALPVAHGEGRFVARDPETLAELRSGGRAALVYCDDAGNPASYPGNPNGSDGGIAALTNTAGNVLGLMPHPERDAVAGQAPAGRADGAGLSIFTNAVKVARS